MMSKNPAPVDRLAARPLGLRLVGLAVMSMVCGLSSVAQTVPSPPAFGQELEGFAYPYPVANFRFSSQRQDLQMAYMDVAAATPNGQTAVLFHGKNFCSATWKETIDVLSAHGYRVVAVDQIGFCKSSKPGRYQYTFQQLARNTHALVESLHVDSPILVAHSTGGMIAVRYALMYPQQTSKLVLVDPIGLEDWKAKGVPSISVDEWYARELKTTADKIRNYEQATYYAGTWKPAYEVWVDMLAGLNSGPGKSMVAWNSALLYDMIYTQPVVYEFGNIATPTLLIIGDKDTTAIGKDLATPAVRATLGHYSELGKQAAARIPGATLVELPASGHAPQIQEPAKFHEALLNWLQPASRDTH
jgi:pimeloyl-ACP methyl ester carboxylesterase